MIRVLYWLMVFVEAVILLLTILIFMITDSDTIHVVAEDFLAEHNISYASISGNLITGIEIRDLRQHNQPLLQSATVHWNPLTLNEKKINITQLDIKGAQPLAILAMVQSFSSDKRSTKASLGFDIVVNRIHLSANPFTYQGVEFRDFYLGTDRFEIDRDLTIDSDYFTLVLNSDLVNLSVRGEATHNRLMLDEARLLEIDPKMITQFVHNIRHTADNNASSSPQTASGTDANGLMLDTIAIQNVTATMKTTTYGPITIDKTEVVAKEVTIEPINHFNYNAKEATLKTDTSFASTQQTGYIKDSMLYTQGDIMTKPHLFERYRLPLNQKGLKRLPSKVSVNHEGVWVEINDKVKELLVLGNSDFNVDIQNVKHKMDYRYKDQFIKITSHAKAAMTYSDDADIESYVDIDFRKHDTKTTYYGTVKLNSVKVIPEHIVKNLLQNVTADYRGTPQGLKVEVKSTQLKGTFETKGYETAILELASKERVRLAQIIKNPPPTLADASGLLQSKSTLDLHQSERSDIHVMFDSDVANIKTAMSLKKPYRINYDGTIPKNSWIYRLDERLRPGSLSLFRGEVVLYPQDYGIVFQSDNLAMRCRYNSQNGYLSQGVIALNTESVTFEGDVENNFQLSASLENVQPFVEQINRYYALELVSIKGPMAVQLKWLNGQKTAIRVVSPDLHYDKVHGDILAHIDIDSSGRTAISAKSDELTYDDHNGITQKLYALSTNFSLEKNLITLDRYSLRIRGNEYLNHIYAKQPSYLTLEDQRLVIKELWVNDQIKIVGNYDMGTQRGEFRIDSDEFGYKNKDFDILSRLKLAIKANQGEYYISGNVKLLDAKSTYEVLGSGMAEDSDIVIVQEQQKKQSSALNKVKAYITIDNDKPISYASKDINIKFTNNMYVAKGMGDKTTIFKQAWRAKRLKEEKLNVQNIQLVGQTHILDGYYQQDDKRFYLAGSNIYFYGDPTRPLLEIRATYQKEQYNIQIFITGSADDPIINFNSDPYLSQKEILSLILFDATTSSSGTGSNTELYAMLGGTFAKELMKSLGLNVDHLLLGEGIDETLSVEVGRKISDNITVIYQHENGRDGVKLRVDHNDNFETDIIIQPPDSSSIEFLHKSD